jgi:hypothetical protein
MVGRAVPDWDKPTPPAPPGPTAPGTNPTDPGWAPTVQQEVEKGKKATGRTESPQIRFEIKRGAEVNKFLEGAAPGAWERCANVTCTFQSPYRDYTRFRRKYPSIIWGIYREITVTIHLVWDATTTWDTVLTYWELVKKWPATDHWVYRWQWTSWEVEMDVPGGGKNVARMTDETPPGETENRPQDDDLASPWDPFPPGLIPRPLKSEAPPTEPVEPPRPKRVGMLIGEGTDAEVLVARADPGVEPDLWFSADDIAAAAEAAAGD